MHQNLRFKIVPMQLPPPRPAVFFLTSWCTRSQDLFEPAMLNKCGSRINLPVLGLLFFSLSLPCSSFLSRLRFSPQPQRPLALGLSWLVWMTLSLVPLFSLCCGVCDDAFLCLSPCHPTCSSSFSFYVCVFARFRDRCSQHSQVHR